MQKITLIIAFLLCGYITSAAFGAGSTQAVQSQQGKRRNPFEKTEKQRTKKKNESDGIASNYPVENLTVSGTVVQDDKKWAFIVDPNGKRYKVVLGSVVGNQAAVVTGITHKYVILEQHDGQTKQVITLSIQRKGP